MNDWLVHMAVDDPNVLHDAGAAAELSRREAARAAELARDGALIRVWRDTGRWASWSLWRAETATQLHALVSSLPAWRHARVTVHPLAAHPNDPGA